MNPQDISTTAFNGGLLVLFGWLVKWAAGTFAAKQDATTNEIRGMKEAIIGLPHALKDILRDDRRDEDERRASREHAAAERRG